MADFGLKVVNSSGFIQIDSTYKNLGLRTKGIATSGGSPVGDVGWYYATVTISAGVGPVIAFRSSGKSYLRYSTVSGGTITYYFHCQGSGVLVWYWVFDDPSLATLSGTYGLRVRDGSGAIAFDSRTSYMRVIDAITGAGAPGSDPIEGGFTRGYSGVPAVVQGQLRYQVINTLVGGQPPNATTIQSLLAAAVSFPGVSVAWRQENPASATFSRQQNVDPPISHLAYDYLVLDVSNM
ncbi:hypothetical protein AB4851_20825 [Burkholderia sp. 22PA0099]|uniref:hypothetical protein n=1 Tax=Burkholderia sp. 22PA0099 TaxID=3237372 RepID=UPI0039C1CC3F